MGIFARSVLSEVPLLRWRKLKTEMKSLRTHQMFTIHITLEKFENGSFTLEMHKMFSALLNSTLSRRILKTQHLPVILPKVVFVVNLVREFA